MNKNQIKARLIQRDGTINAVAKRIREPASMVSATITYKRLNLRIRMKLIREYGVRFSPKISTALSQRKPRRTKPKDSHEARA